MYKAVIFDFGNVLCEVDRMAFSSEVAKYCPHAPEEIDRMLWGGDLEHSLETGALDTASYFQAISRRLDLSGDYTFDHFCRDFKKIIVPHPQGEKALVEAKRLGARCFVLSNTSFLHATTIFGNEILASVPELHILSYKVGMMKPDTRIWRVLLDYARLKPGDCLFIDDVPAYCAAAESLGIRAFCYDKSAHDLSQIVRNMLQ